ncbi:hypothetical protein SAMN05428978_102013 [Nitrosomonas sp. Nm34]|nr:hypothetical protein SAMN05428978_102013 [Nitrosomonas sp. Nm34]
MDLMKDVMQVPGSRLSTRRNMCGALTIHRAHQWYKHRMNILHAFA